jgi:hypothetical protein
MNKIIMDLIVALTCGVITWAIQTVIKHVIPFIESKLKESQYSWAADIIANAVRAYEQTVSGSGMGEDKFQLVMDFVNRELSKHGIKLSEEQITVLIESAVQAMNAEQIVIEEPTAIDYYEAGKSLDEGIKAGITDDNDVDEIVAVDDLSDEEIDKFRPRPKEKRVTNNSKGVTVRKE